jgi:hypothetical protein
VLLLGALLAVAPGRGGAEDRPAPLAEMRAAAEAQADVDPEAAPLPHREVLSGKKPAAAGSPSGQGAAPAAAKDGARAALQAAVRSAVQAEIAREVQGIGAGSDAAKGSGRGRDKDTPGASAAEPGRSQAAHANEAAAQAQQARLNRTVGQERGLGPIKNDKKMVGKPLILPAAPSGRTGR